VETRDYLRALGRRAWILIVLPVVAAVIAAAVVLVQPAEHESTATVLTHPSISLSGSTVAYVTSFQAALTSGTILDQVSAKTGIPTATLQTGLTAAPSAANSVTMNVTYAGTQDSATISSVPVIAARDVLTILITPQITSGQAQVNAAQSQVTAAQAALAAFTSRTGLFNPTQDYQSLSSQLVQLRVLRTSTLALGTHSSVSADSAVAVIDQEIASTTAQLAKLGPQVAAYSALQTNLSRAQTALQSAEAQVLSAQQQLSLTSAAGGVAPGSVTKVSRTKTLIKTAGPAALVGFIVAVGWVIFTENRKLRAQS
jgi:hypothetical protein